MSRLRLSPVCPGLGDQLGRSKEGQSGPGVFEHEAAARWSAAMWRYEAAFALELGEEVRA